jgi:hypothetical protein
LSLVAVSLDCNEAHYNRPRGSPTAFADALGEMAVLVQSNVRFGAVMTGSRVTLRRICSIGSTTPCTSGRTWCPRRGS